jgi:tRNA-guanine family transglycosylase
MIIGNGNVPLKNGTIVPVHNLRNTLFLHKFGLNDSPLMISAVDLIRRPNLRRTVGRVGIKEYLGVTGPILIDSGGFSLMSERCAPITAAELAAIYSDLSADVYAALDLPPGSTDNTRQRAQKWSQTLTNLDHMLEVLVQQIVMPVIHGRTLDEIAAACRDVRQRIDPPPIVALGGMVPFLRGHMPNRRFRYQRIDGSSASGEMFVADAISVCRGEFPLSHLHVLGVGSTTTAIAVLVLGADSVDSLAWRRAAGFGTIFLAGRAERIISRKPRVLHSRPRVTSTDRRALENCECPVCTLFPRLADRIRALSDSYIARAVHNVWTLRVEEVALRNAVAAGELSVFSASRISGRHRFAEIVRQHIGSEAILAAHQD